MRSALSVAAVAVMLSSAAFTTAARANDCMADPMAAIKAAEGDFKKVKASLDKAATRGFNKSIDKAKMAAKTKVNDVACASLSDALGFLAPKK
tara:strand:+ start:786 stop:1064 length:279 start_codon:yes stop_codon:yes gene_type:complete